MRTSTRPNPCPKLEADATLNQANPTQNLYYTILDTVTNVLIHDIVIAIQTTGEDLQVRLTIDGVTYTITGAGCVAGTTYRIYIRAGTDGVFTTSHENPLCRFNSLPARSFKAEVRKTSAAGAGNLQGWVMYSRY